MFAEIRDEGKEKIKEERKTKMVDVEIGIKNKREECSKNCVDQR